jgi:putative ABC transport system permease protein
MLVIGGCAVAVAVLLTAVAAASRAGHDERRRGFARPSRLGELFRVLPAVPALGSRLALGGGRASSGAAWAGVGAVAVGVAGVLAVGTVERSVHHLLTTPTDYGAPWDAVTEIEGAETDAALDEGIDALADDPDIELVATMRQPVVDDGEMEAHGPSGQARVEPFTFDVARGPVPLVVADGRVPGPGEAAVGAEVLDRLGAQIGDQVEIVGSAGSVPVTIVGRTINAGTDELDQGFYVPPETMDRLLAGCPSADDSRCQTEAIGVGVGFRDGVDRNAALARARAIVPDLQPTPRPSVVDSLAEIGSTPTWLGGFLGLLGLAGLIHALLVGGRRSEHDLAVSRALGLRPRQASRAIAWGAGLVAAAGAVIGVALGLLLGRLVWQRVVAGVGSLLDTETPRGLLLAVPAGAVLIAVMVAIVPGHRAASVRPGDALRAE